MNTTAKLLLHCPDQPGILAEVTNFITINKGNIVYLDQYVDHDENTILDSAKRSPWFRVVIENYKIGNLYFEDQNIKNEFLTILSKSL